MRVSIHALRSNPVHSRLYGGACLLVILFPILIGVASWIDGTWKMAGTAKGLSQHYGFWVIFISAPIVFVLTRYLLSVFTRTMENIDAFCVDKTPQTRRRLRKLIHRHVLSLSFRSRALAILLFIVFVLFTWWLFNVIKTISPIETYHHDVFDSYAHPWGFAVTKVYTLLVFLLIYSVSIFTALHVTVSMISILKFLSKENMLRVDLFHEDNCGGTSTFGNINLLILAIYSNFLAVDFAMYLTHRRTYLAIVVSLAAATVLAFAQSVIAVYYIHTSVQKKKRQYLKEMNNRLNQQFDTSFNRFPGGLLVLRNHVVDIHTYPYGKSTFAIVNCLRLTPALLAVVAYATK